MVKIAQIFILLVSLLMISGCQMTDDSETFDPERAALARLKLGLGYLAQSSESEENIKLAHYNLSLAKQYSPNNTHVMLGMALFDQHVGELNEAEMIYKNILRKEPKNGLFINHYASFLCATSRYHDAKVQFEESIQLEQRKWKIVALEQLGYCAIQNQDVVVANKAFSQLFQYDSTKRQSVTKTAELYRQNGDVMIADYLLKIVN